MPYELTIITCGNCQAQIALDNSTIRLTNRPKIARDVTEHGYHHEGICPKCDSPFEIWYLSSSAITSTHIADAENYRPELFIANARERVNNAAADQTETARLAELHQREREDRKKTEEAERQKIRLQTAEKERLKEEAVRAARAKAHDDGDWDDDDDDSGGPSQADLDNHADQMNPNNDAYWSSRG